MPAKVPDPIIDLQLDPLQGTECYITAGEPTSRSNAIALSLAAGTLTGGDYSKAAGDVSGRKQITAQKTDLSITATGTGDHVVVCDATQIRDITTCDAQLLTSGGTVTVPSWSHELRDSV